jgi:SMC interacting uncharacterized protein involved in chromosome segregation
MAASSIIGILKDVLTLTEEVKRLNTNTAKLADKVEGIDRRLVRIETLIEVAKVNPARITVNDQN